MKEREFVRVRDLYICVCTYMYLSVCLFISVCVRARAQFYVSLSCPYNYFFVPVVCVWFCFTTVFQQQ